MKRTIMLASLVLSMLVAVPGLGAQQVSSAEAAYHAKDWAKAAGEYETITQHQPKNGVAWYRLGASRHFLGQYEQAIAAFQQALDLGFARPIATYNIAAGYARLGNKAKALEWLDHLVALGFQGVKQLEADEDFAGVRSDAGFQQVMEKLHRNATPCEYSAEHRQFDFWIGEWNVQSPTGQPAGTSSVERILNGCVIFENWSGGGGGDGKSLNIYNVPKRKWQQYWVESSGTVIFFEGGWEEGAMRLVGETFPLAQGTTPAAAPGMSLRRMTFTPLGPDKVRQMGEASEDGGKTWTLEYDLTYIRKAKSQ